MLFQEIPIGSYIAFKGMEPGKYYRVIFKSYPYQIHLTNSKIIHMNDFIGLADEPPPNVFKRKGCHQKQQKWEEIKLGAEISWVGEVQYTVYRVIRKPQEGALRIRWYSYGEQNYAEDVISMMDYISTIVYSLGNNREITAWSEAELYYGINHHGDLDPDPRRRLAFAILRGDPIALDIATDVIERGG